MRRYGISIGEVPNFVLSSESTSNVLLRFINEVKTLRKQAGGTIYAISGRYDATLDQTMKTEEIQASPHYGIVNLERRKYPRLDINLPLEYVRSDISTNLGRAGNASEGGLLIWIREKMELGQTLRIKLFFPSGPKLLASIRAEVEIVWKDISCGGDSGDSRFGVKFVDISHEDLQDLKDFLKNLN